MRIVLFITLLCSTLFSAAQNKIPYIQTQRTEMIGYMFSVDSFDWYFVPCNDSRVHFLNAIANYSDKSFLVQHSLGCGKGIHYSNFSELGNSLIHTFKYTINSSASNTVRYFYSKIWIDLDSTDKELNPTGLLTTLINNKEYQIGSIFYSDNELIEIEPYDLDIRRKYLQTCYDKKLPLPHWLKDEYKILIKSTH